MGIDPEFLFYSALYIGGGLYLFYSGFRELKTKRTIENIPTSKISTGAVGSNVEIKGPIDSEVQNLIQAPISGRDCLFFSIEIQEEVRSKDHTYWKTLDQFYSHDGFYLNDGSGARALVYVQGAKIIRERFNKEFLTRSNRLDELPPALIQALSENRDKLKRFKWKNTSWLFSNRIRFLEWCFYEHEPIYVLGHAQSGLKIKKKQKLKLKHFLFAKNKIEQDDSLKERFDENADGILDEAELERGAKILGFHHQSSQKTEDEKPRPAIKMIFRHSPPHPFVISNLKESDLVKSMNFESVFKLFGGPVVAMGGIYFLLSKLQ
jgi:hypothetical protein